MMSLINREALYEKACGLEAQALAYVGKIANDETKIEKWRIWSAILAERTAFKHDIFDAPEVKPEPPWIPCSERLPEENGEYLVTREAKGIYKYVDIVKKTNASGDIASDIVAWMPLPSAYREEGE